MNSTLNHDQLSASACADYDAAPLLPRSPRTIAESGLDASQITELCAKLLLTRGRKRSLRDLAGLIHLPPSVVSEVLAYMRVERLVELTAHSGVEADAEFQLSDAGRAFAREALGHCQYVGPAPVTLAAYCERVAAHSMRHVAIDAAYVRRSFQSLELAPAIVDQLGAAMNSGRAILIHGPAGTGKTFLAEHLALLQPGTIAVPYALTVGGEIIQVFDPLVHEPAGDALPPRSTLMRADRDERWVCCRRPVVIVGGELTLPMLDLQFDATTGYYQAPPHMKANGGLFVVDDLGRQMVAPQDLMNRWIVPLDRQRDYLSLHTGFRFTVPFDLTVVFSTNLRPDELADEAFLRRFGYKIPLGALDRDRYHRIFEAACDAMGVTFDAAALAWLLRERHKREGRELFACYPRDLVERVRDFSIYEGTTARLSPETLARAWQAYFFAPDNNGRTSSAGAGDRAPEHSTEGEQP